MSPGGARGKVWLVGAGPGDPELLTRKAYSLLTQADVVAFDELVSSEILSLAPAGAERIPVGRRAKGCRHHDARIHPLIVERALQGKDVVRLKGGDPLVFGRGGEEVSELAAHGISFAIVPGITAALGAAASCGIPLTHREHASMVTLATAHAAQDQADQANRANPQSGDERGAEGALANDEALDVPPHGTLVFYMGLGRLEPTCVALVARGRSAQTPAAVVSRATLPGERVVLGTLASIASRVRDAGLEAPAVLIVGEVVAQGAVPRRGPDA